MWEDSELLVYELIHRSRTEPQSLPPPSESDDDLVKPTSRLPPKPLPGRRKYLPFIVVSLITAFTITALAILISKIKDMLPQTEWDGIWLTGTSCDLMDTQNSSRLQSAFQINLRGAAHLSFAEAKFIDLFFDLLVGQGGRLLLAALSYIVFMDALLRSMEITPVSYKLYASMVFSPTSLIASWYSVRAVSTTKGWRAKTYLIWSAFAMLYVLAFPTLIESATGYVSPSSTGFNMANGTMVMADSDRLLGCLNITGGLLLGQETNNTKALGPPAHLFDPMHYPSGMVPKDEVPPVVNTTGLFYQLITSDPDKNYTATNSTTSPLDECLSRSRYNSSCWHNHMDYNFTTNITIDGKLHKLNNVWPSELWTASYCYDDTMIEPDQLQESPYCITKSYFVWGFSSIVLYIILGLQIIWTFGMFCVWLDANIASELVKSGPTIRGPFRAAADLVEAMNETLGHEYCAYTDKEITKELKKSGDMLRYNSSLRDDDGLLHVGLTTKLTTTVFLSRKKPYGAKGAARRKTMGSEGTD